MRAIKRNLGLRSRHGVTILEVLFAIGVVVVGLLGIASIIPLAARSAKQSRNHNNAQALGQVWLNDFFSRGLNKHDTFTTEGVGFNWQWYLDYQVGGRNPGIFDAQKNFAANPIATGFLRPGTNQSPGSSLLNSGVQVDRIWGHQAFCIDPTFFSEPTVKQRVQSATGRLRGYRLSVFPYFEEGLNPVSNPLAPTLNWPEQPRMVRASFGFGAGGSLTSHISRKLTEEIFASSDELSVFTNEKDKTIPPTRSFAMSPVGAMKGLNTREYSWMATVSPREPRQVEVNLDPDGVSFRTTNDYLVSLVIFHQREREFLAPTVTGTNATTDDVVEGERMVWVQPLTGAFVGGTGGRVRLISNATIDDDVTIGDWVMLGRHEVVNWTDLTERYAKFRWYRIIAVDEDSRVDRLANVSTTGTDPFGNGGALPVWSRDVVLEGPDWDFAPLVNPTGGTLTVPTTGTLMKNVVTVLERSVSVE